MTQIGIPPRVAPHCVLVLEDDPSSRELIKFQLEQLGYDSDRFANAEEGFEKWQTNRYKIVLTDCNLPGMSGFDLAAAIRAEEHSGDSPTTVVGITGYRLDDVDEEYRRSGMDFCLEKPVLLADIQEIFPGRASGDAESPGPADLRHDGIALRNLVGDNRDKCCDLLSALVNSLQDGIRALDNAYENRAASRLTSTAHRLRSSALAVGANVLASLCRQTEAAGRDEDWQILGAMHPALIDAADNLVQDAMDLVGCATNSQPLASDVR